jgi:ADP-heptose:LPS heptosyltransferase/predicted SAM-dependent methyltransferase
MSWSIDGAQGFEAQKIKYLLPKYTRGKVLEIGPGLEKAFPHFVGYDSGHHFGPAQPSVDVIGDAADLGQFKDESFDAVFSSHCLEHLDDMAAALGEWCRVLKPGGFLCLYVPSANLYPLCGEPGANPDHKHDIYPDDIATMLDDSPFWFQQVECEERNQGNEYSLFEVYKKLTTEDGTDADCVTIPLQRSQGKKTACVVRFGGFGDMLQAAGVFPQLQAQGFHVTVMTTPKGQEVLQHDPFIDDWYIVDTDQVPNNELHAFWAAQSERFDRFVNLSESIEGTLLALPGRVNHAWPHAVRKKRLNLNYHEWTAELAGVEFKPCALFWPTDSEIDAAQQLLTWETPTFNVLWALSGSSIHKFTPHQDAVMARMLIDMPEVRIFLVGDLACQLLEQGWEEEPRVLCLSDKLSIRETLALAQQVDLVIGPETGVLNAVGMEKTPHKILLLSHSSANNLSKHWQHTQALAPSDCACYPCHQLHYGPELCEIEPDGPARCAVNIGPERIYAAVEKVYRNWQAGRLA